jgi:MazG family protein
VTETVQHDGGAGSDPSAAVAALWELTKRLRRDCPWDRAQTAATIVPHTLEEAYEVAQAVHELDDDSPASDNDALRALEDELGDLLFQVSFLAMWCEELDPSINLGSVATRIHDKLVARHPHVFGDAAAATADEVRATWEQVKSAGGERGLFDGIPRSMPATTRAVKAETRAAKIGFDFPRIDDALAKAQEELDELRSAIRAAREAGTLPEGEERPPDPHVEWEVGDLLFAATNVARMTRVDPELALSYTTQRFVDRVTLASLLARGAGEAFDELDIDAQEAWYQRARAQLGFL